MICGSLWFSLECWIYVFSSSSHIVDRFFLLFIQYTRTSMHWRNPKDCNYVSFWKIEFLSRLFHSFSTLFDMMWLMARPTHSHTHFPFSSSSISWHNEQVFSVTEFELIKRDFKFHFVMSFLSSILNPYSRSTFHIHQRRRMWLPMYKMKYENPSISRLRAVTTKKLFI